MPWTQSDSAVTWNGSYLVAWRDTRDDAAGDIYAVHLPTSTTDPLDSDSFYLNVAEGNTSPAVTGGAAAHRFVDAMSITGYGIFSEGMRLPAPK